MLGKRIREYREAKGLTQAQFGAMIGAKQQQISTYESGRCQPEVPRRHAIEKLLQGGQGTMTLAEAAAMCRKQIRRGCSKCPLNRNHHCLTHEAPCYWKLEG